MNARISSLHARMVPAALAAAVALAFGLSAPAQAQYAYPGTASSSRHAAKAAPVRAESRERPAYGTAPAHYGYGNPSMQKGEACPPGSACAPHGPGQQANGGGAAPSGAYGAHESYGYAAPQTVHQQAAAPASRNAITGPVRAGSAHGAVNYGPSAVSNANFRNSVTGKSSGPNMNPSGQPTSFTGPNGQQVNLNGMSNPSITGPNGQKVGMGDPDLNHLGGGYGHQKGSGLNMGGTVSYENGSGSETRTGSAPGMANGGIDAYKAGNGASGAADQPSDAPSKPDGKTNSTGEIGNWFDSDWGHPHDGKDSHGNTWKDGNLDTGFDDKGVYYKDGKPDPGHTGSKIPGYTGGNNSDTADTGATAGPGEVVNGAGNVVTPGKHKGQDTGGGQTGDPGTNNSGGQNAQGQYIAPSGQDNLKKPKEAGTLKMDYNGKNGAIDPKLNGSNGGGG